MQWEYRGVIYPTRSEMCRARREHYAMLLKTGMNFTQAAHAVGVSKRTGKVWRNGRSRSTGRNEKPYLNCYGEFMDTLQDTHPRYLSQAERIKIADMLILGHTQTEIAQALGRNKSTISREIARNKATESDEYMPYHAQDLAYARKSRPKKRKILTYEPLHSYIQQKLLPIGRQNKFLMHLSLIFPIMNA